MSTDNTSQDPKGIDRRGILKAGAIGAAGLAVAGLGVNTAQAKNIIPDQENLWTNSNTGRRVAILNDTAPADRRAAGYRARQGRPRPGDRPTGERTG